MTPTTISPDRNSGHFSDFSRVGELPDGETSIFTIGGLPIDSVLQYLEGTRVKTAIDNGKFKRETPALMNTRWWEHYRGFESADAPESNSYNATNEIDSFLENPTFAIERKVLEMGGVLPTKSRAKVLHKNIYAPNDPTKDLNEYFGNVGEHGMAVGRLAAEIAILLKETYGSGYLRRHGTSVEQITKRGLVHDANKLYERLRKEARVSDTYSNSAYRKLQGVLRANGVTDTKTLAYLADAGKETGHGSLTRFVRMNKSKKPVLKGSLEEKIVHLADDMAFSAMGSPETFFVGAEERVIRSDFPMKYPFLYFEGIGFNREGRAVDNIGTKKASKPVLASNPPANLRGVRPYVDWQVWVSDQIAGEILKKKPGERKGASTELAQIMNARLGLAR